MLSGLPGIQYHTQTDDLYHERLYIMIIYNSGKSPYTKVSKSNMVTMETTNLTHFQLDIQITYYGNIFTVFYWKSYISSCMVIVSKVI